LINQRLPDASINTVHLADDIKSIGDIGAGVIELCNFYLVSMIKNVDNLTYLQ
jgi:hypothetical protein